MARHTTLITLLVEWDDTEEVDPVGWPWSTIAAEGLSSTRTKVLNSHTYDMPEES